MWSALLFLGVVVGLLAGLFGIGGGTLLVPVLTLLFLGGGMESSAALHLALGSSMASIVVTACASAWAHYKLGTIRWQLVAQLSPGIVVGTAVVALLVPYLDARGVAAFFVLYVVAVACHMLYQPQRSGGRLLPCGLALSLIGGSIGGISALVSIGGGTMVVPFLSWCGVTIQQAIGTSAVIGVVISVVGTICYGAANISYGAANITAVDSMVTGAIYLPAVLLISVASMAMAPVGARWGQRVSAQQLRYGYVAMLFMLSVVMLLALLV
ncbi:MAG: sulfite exporter TauE/SafE family protein [Mariprofundales bacterium]|nr:sulfite exporter TauE/SafE family protein [Mariprofundales bacterium]